MDEFIFPKNMKNMNDKKENIGCFGWVRPPDPLRGKLVDEA